MARNQTNDRLLTFKKAQGYLSDQGFPMSTNQVRNYARTNELIMAGVAEYTDPVTDETTKVIAQSALDRFIEWKRANPETQRGGRKSDGMKRYTVRIPVDQLDAVNELLANNGYPALEAPKIGTRKPRKAKSDAASNGTSEIQIGSDAELQELELIEVE